MARPKKEESLLRRIERYRYIMTEEAVDIMMDLFQELKDIPFDKNATHASRMQAIKMINEIVNEFERLHSQEQLKPSTGGSSDDEDDDDTAPLIPKSFGS